MTNNDIAIVPLRSLFYRLNQYMTENTLETSSKEFLHKWYFDLYETMYANGIKIGSNYFLSIFQQFTKNKNTYLYNELQKLSDKEYVECHNYFMDTQVNIRYLDYLLDSDFSFEVIKDEITGLQFDMDPSNKYSVPMKKEERRIHIETIQRLEVLLQKDAQAKDGLSDLHLYLDGSDLDNIAAYIQSYVLSKEQLKICSNDVDLSSIKQMIIGNTRRFKKVFTGKPLKPTIGIQFTKEESFTRDLFINALKKAFIVELYFNCYANEKSRSKLKTRAFSKKEKYADIKDFASDYYALTKGKKASLSYIPLLVFGLDVGLNMNAIYMICNKYYSFNCKSELNRIEFNKNVELFSKKASSRYQLDSYIDNFSKDNFEEMKYALYSSDDSNTNVYKEFHDFLIYYIVSNKMDLVDNNIFLDGKVISIEDNNIDNIMSNFDETEYKTVSAIVLTKEDIERIQKL